MATDDEVRDFLADLRKKQGNRFAVGAQHGIIWATNIFEKEIKRIEIELEEEKIKKRILDLLLKSALGE